MKDSTKERIGGALAWLCFPFMVLGFFWVIGTATERAAEYREDHDRCLRQATNGLEIKQCR